MLASIIRIILFIFIYLSPFILKGISLFMYSLLFMLIFLGTQIRRKIRGECSEIFFGG
jgi:hypothetical protein